MATRAAAKTAKKTPAKKAPARKTVAEKRAASKAVEAKAAKVAAKAPKLDVASLYSDTLDVIERRQGIDTSGLDVAPPMSTGLLQIDQMLGGGIRSCMLTGAGNEQCAKTTLALTAMAAAIKEEIPLIAFIDYEGCVTRDTLISFDGGRQIRLDKLFDLRNYKKWKQGEWQDQYVYADTLSPGHSYGCTKVAMAQLYYKGVAEVSRITTASGHSLNAHGHKFWVYDNHLKRFAQVSQRNLRVGDLVLVQKSFATQEKWTPAYLGTMNVYHDSFVAKHYEVSSLGNVRPLEDMHTVGITTRGAEAFDDEPKDVRQSKIIASGTNIVQAAHTPNAYVDFVVDFAGQRVQVKLSDLVYASFNRKAAEVVHLNGNSSDHRLHNLISTEDLAATRSFLTKEEHAIIMRSALPDCLDHLTIFDYQKFITRVKSKKVYAAQDTKSILDWNFQAILEHFDITQITQIENTKKREPVFDLGISSTSSSFLPHSIITDGIVTHNSTKNSKPYVQSILKGSGINLSVDQVFGKKDKATGQWVTPPRVRYRSETILERFYDWLSQVLRELPDKRYVAGSWWLVFDEKNKKHVAKVGSMADKEMQRRYGSGLWVPAPNDKIQGIIFLDSYTAMNPEVKDEESISNQLSVKASAFSKQLERVKGRMADKMVTIYGLNHLRANPMAMFGPSEDEKGGNALKQFSDVRLRQTSRSLSGPKAYFSPKPGKKGGKTTYNEIEPSVEYPGAKDEYRYVHVRAHKNKLWTPNREGWLRIWVEDGAGVARGIDPFFDVMAYLKDTGQVKGNRGNLKLNLEGLGAAKKSITWADLKRWVLGDKPTMAKIATSLGYKPMSLKHYCFKQMKSGVAEDLYVKVRAAKDASGGDGDDAEE